MLQVMSMAVGDILMHVPEELEGAAEVIAGSGTHRSYSTGRAKRSLSPPLWSMPEPPNRRAHTILLSPGE